MNHQTDRHERRHGHQSPLQKVASPAIHRTEFAKRVTSHAFRNCSAPHLLADGYDIPTLPEPSSAKDVSTTTIHTHVSNRGGRGLRALTDLRVRARQARSDE